MVMAPSNFRLTALVLFSLSVTEVFSVCSLSEHHTLSGSDGVLIRSPGYPNNYGSNAQKCWSFTAGFLGTVTIQISWIDTQAKHDFLNIFEADPYSKVGDLIASVSGTVSRLIYTSSGPGMFVSFTSDASIQSTGFEACVCATNSFFAGCICPNSGLGRTTVTTTVSSDQCAPSTHNFGSDQFEGVRISSPGYPDNYYPYEDVCWILMAGQGTVYLSIPEMHTQDGYDNITIKEVDGDGRIGRQIAHLTGNQVNLTYTSISRGLYVRFTSDGSIQYSGFQACACPAGDALCVNFYCGDIPTMPGVVIPTAIATPTTNRHTIFGTVRISLSVGIPLVILVIIISCACCCARKRSSRRAPPTVIYSAAGRTNCAAASTDQASVFVVTAPRGENVYHNQATQGGFSDLNVSGPVGLPGVAMSGAQDPIPGSVGSGLEPSAPHVEEGLAPPPAYDALFPTKTAVREI